MQRSEFFNNFRTVRSRNRLGVRHTSTFSDIKMTFSDIWKLIRKIENFLKTRVNECMKNDKFKELPIPTIYRIIESAIINDRETVEFNILFDFIVESEVNRFILFRFVELHRLNKDRIDEFIKFIDEQEESSKHSIRFFIF